MWSPTSVRSVDRADLVSMMEANTTWLNAGSLAICGCAHHKPLARARQTEQVGGVEERGRERACICILVLCDSGRSLRSPQTDGLVHCVQAQNQRSWDKKQAQAGGSLCFSMPTRVSLERGFAPVRSAESVKGRWCQRPHPDNRKAWLGQLHGPSCTTQAHAPLLQLDGTVALLPPRPRRFLAAQGSVVSIRCPGQAALRRRWAGGVCWECVPAVVPHPLTCTSPVRLAT